MAGGGGGMAFLVHELLAETAARAGGRTALVAGPERRSFAELAGESARLAAVLRDLGVRRGDRVAVMLENGIVYAAAVFAISRAGGVYVPVNPATKADKLAFILADCGVTVLLAPAALAVAVVSAVQSLRVPPAVLWVGASVPAGVPGHGLRQALGSVATADPCPAASLIDQDLAAIAYTSGTTGRPKGVMLTHANLVQTSRAIARSLGNVPDDVVLCVLPLTFGYGLSQLLTAALVGFTLVLERSFAFPRDTLARLVECRVTGLPGVPAVFSALLGLEALAEADLSSLRYLTNAAAPLPEAHLRRLLERFPQAAFHSMYGATECSTRIAALDPARLSVHPGSVGRAIPNCETVIVDEQGAPVPAGATGELLVRGANVMRGYWNRPEETARCLRPGPGGHLWFHTGDLFTADADGLLSFVARRDDVFKCRGEKVSPREVEAVLFELDAVADAAVTGVPDPRDGMAVKAFVVLRPGAVVTEADVLRHCRARLEGHLVPRFVTFAGALPRTHTGKVQRFLLTEPA